MGRFSLIVSVVWSVCWLWDPVQRRLSLGSVQIFLSFAFLALSASTAFLGSFSSYVIRCCSTGCLCNCVYRWLILNWNAIECFCLSFKLSFRSISWWHLSFYGSSTGCVLWWMFRDDIRSYADKYFKTTLDSRMIPVYDWGKETVLWIHWRTRVSLRLCGRFWHIVWREFYKIHFLYLKLFLWMIIKNQWTIPKTNGNLLDEYGWHGWSVDFGRPQRKLLVKFDDETDKAAIDVHWGLWDTLHCSRN